MGIIRAGDLRHRVDIKRQVQTKKPSGGGFDTVWETVGTVWAQVLGQNGREATIGQAMQGITVYRVVIRYRADISDADQLRYGSIDLNIRSIADPDGRRQALSIIADTGSAQATS